MQQQPNMLRNQSTLQLIPFSFSRVSLQLNIVTLVIMFKRREQIVAQACALYCA
jgi:hypothetical protein